MDLHEFIEVARDQGHLIVIEREVDPYLEMAREIAAVDGRPVLFTCVRGSRFPVVSGVCSDRRYFGLALDVPPDQIIFRLADALESPQPPPVWTTGPCQEVTQPEVDLGALPFLTHYPDDAGAYASAAVVFINDPETGPNASYHRLLRLGKDRVTARIVERRGTDTAWRRLVLGGAAGYEAGLPVSICIGLPLHVLLAASMAPPAGVDELTIAQALADTPVVQGANGICGPRRGGVCAGRPHHAGVGERRPICGPDRHV